MPSLRTSTFTESVIREMTRVAQQHGAINLAQGFPDFPMPEPMKDAAAAAIHGDVNQYAITWGSPSLRLAIAEKYRRWYDFPVDTETEITVTCGATEAMAAVFLALVDQDDEVIVFEPFYENYGPDAILAGAKPVFVPLEPPDWHFDKDRLAAAFTIAHEGHHRQHAAQSHRPRVLARGTARPSPNCASRTTCGRSPTRSTSTFVMRGTTTCWPGSPACANAR